MLNLTKKTDYALIALSAMAARGNMVLSARAIAQEYEAPLPLLMNILKRLSAAGLLDSVRGSRGGYRLSKPADQIDLAEVIESLEGPIRLSSCAARAHQDSGDHECRLGAECPISEGLLRVHHRIRDVLVHTTVADLMRGGELNARA